MAVKWIVIISIVVLLVSIAIISTHYISLSTYFFDSPKLTLKNPLRIIHLSDFHNTRFFPDNEALFDIIKKQQPHAILFSGDIIDRHNPDEEAVFKFLGSLINIAPVYFVTGNHEYYYHGSHSFLQKLKQTDIHFLDNQIDIIEVEGQKVEIIGLSDHCKIKHMDRKEYMWTRMKGIMSESRSEHYSILISHKPHFFDIYRTFDIDLILAGHVHGGQIAIPAVGPIFAPDEGFFPKLASGKVEDGNTTMIINRGLGNGRIPFRFFANPEVGLITIE